MRVWLTTLVKTFSNSLKEFEKQQQQHTRDKHCPSCFKKSKSDENLSLNHQYVQTDDITFSDIIVENSRDLQQVIISRKESTPFNHHLDSYEGEGGVLQVCLLYTSPSPRDS